MNSTEIHFLNILKKIHYKFQKCYLFMDKATPHYTCKKVIKYFEDNKDTLIPVYLPTASPEFMVIEKVWSIAKRDLLVLKYYASFADLKNKISRYFRTKRFNYNPCLCFSFQFFAFLFIIRKDPKNTSISHILKNLSHILENMASSIYGFTK